MSDRFLCPTFSRHLFSLLRGIDKQLSKLFGVSNPQTPASRRNTHHSSPKYCPSSPTAMALFRLRLPIASRKQRLKMLLKTS
ncbi:hypothetical protein [uncultured Nostoc sp.]|uniref:hypothetical protein n=1 Tax=uncultured Nostoc sp. TaxID=340711 RepID=UPI0035C9736B